jgi:hypothetical protein
MTDELKESLGKAIREIADRYRTEVPVAG